MQYWEYELFVKNCVSLVEEENEKQNSPSNDNIYKNHADSIMKKAQTGYKNIRMPKL